MLRAATQASVVLGRHATAFQRALAQFPQAGLPNVRSRFHWAVLDVQDRPAVVLVHRMFGRHGDAALVAQRHFYVSRGYDALQFVVALLPVEGGTAVIYENRTVSEQAARFGRLAQTMGRRMLVDEVRRYFEQVRAAVGG
jgi:hypothetical protein